MDRDYVRRVASLVERLRRVDSVLRAWDEYDAARALPKAVRPKEVPKPIVSRQQLRAMWAELMDEVAELEALWDTET